MIRYSDDTIGFAKPAVVSAPRPDPSTVIDLLIAPGFGREYHKKPKLLDMGPLRNHWTFSANVSERPQIMCDAPGSWYYLRFNGKNNRMVKGCLNTPPGPASLEMLIRPHDTKRQQTIMDMWGAAFSLGLGKDGRLNLLREDIERRGVWLAGKTQLQKNRFYHVAAVFDGSFLKLYLNGKLDGSVACKGLRSDEKMTLGVNCGVMEPYTGRRGEWSKAYKGDIGMFRLIERPFSEKEVKERADTALKRMY